MENEDRIILGLVEEPPRARGSAWLHAKYLVKGRDGNSRCRGQLTDLINHEFDFRCINDLRASYLLEKAGVSCSRIARRREEQLLEVSKSLNPGISVTLYPFLTVAKKTTVLRRSGTPM